MEAEKYNGWANWDTWNLALWFGNEEPLYRDAINFIRHPRNQTEDAVRLYCEEFFSNPDGINLKNVDWEEILNDFKEMAGIEED